MPVVPVECKNVDKMKLMCQSSPVKYCRHPSAGFQGALQLICMTCSILVLPSLIIICSGHLDTPLPGGRGLPGEGEDVARLPRVEDHVVSGVLAADHGRGGPVILSHEPGLEYRERASYSKAHTHNIASPWLLEITDLSACSPAVGVPIPWISGGRLVNGEAGKVEPAMCHCHVDANDYDVTRPDLTDVC